MAGIYIHIPFCKQACLYCNFHFSVSPGLQNDFTAALLREIPLRLDYLPGETIHTVYFGGGTPSLLPADQLVKILDRVRQHFSVAADAEITLEANPDDITDTSLAVWRSGGFNRMSLGVQSFFAADLNWMNRAHDAGQAIRSVGMAQSAGFTNLSLDLIYGLPGLTDEQWRENVNTVVGLGVPHVSCYALTVEPKTALHKLVASGRKSDVVSDDQARQFLEAMDWLGAAGYDHYEISNFARPGLRSRHNSSYWQSVPYIGLGPSAHSFDGGSRQWNVANNALYIKSLQQGELPFEKEVLQPADQLNEYIMISLRTMEGLQLNEVQARFGEEKRNVLKEKTKMYLANGQMTADSGKLRLTRAGKLYADGIAADLFF